MLHRIVSFVKQKNSIISAVCAAAILVALIVFAVRGEERYEMTGPEAVKLVRALDNALVARQNADTATTTYNAAMAEVRKAHGWPDDLIFDGTEWKHAPKPPEPAKPEPKK
jgi:hypothetical protein